MAHTLSEAQIKRRMADEMPFSIEQWDAQGLHVFQVLCKTRDVTLGRVAFEKACEVYPNAYLTFRQGIRLVEKRESSK